MKRREGREKGLEGLFEIDMRGIGGEEGVENVVEEGEWDGFLEDLIIGSGGNLKEIEEEMSGCVKKWWIERLGKVDLNVVGIGR